MTHKTSRSPSARPPHTKGTGTSLLAGGDAGIEPLTRCTFCGRPIDGVRVCAEDGQTLHFVCAVPLLSCFHLVQRARATRHLYERPRARRL